MSRGRLLTIRRRINATKSLMKITRAMEMVARAKVRKIEREYRKFREFHEEVENLWKKLPVSSIEHPFFEEGSKRLVVVITGDLGLCGAFNSEIIKEADKLLEDGGSLIAIGNKSTSYVSKKMDIFRSYDRFYDIPDFGKASYIVDDIVDFLKGESGEVYVVYGKFINALIQRPRAERIVPLGKTEGNENLEFEPELEVLIERFLHFYLSTKILNYMFESKISEFYARENAMRNATDNAQDVIRRLTLEYNKARQASITQEIIEIVTGAEALKESEE